MVLAGMSIGLFSAAAVATSSSLFELAHTGPTSVRVAFRFGLHVGQVSHMLEPQGEVRKSWAYVVAGLDVAEVQDALDAYNTDTVSEEVILSFGSSETNVWKKNSDIVGYASVMQT